MDFSYQTLHFTIYIEKAIKIQSIIRCFLAKKIKLHRETYDYITPEKKTKCLIKLQNFIRCLLARRKLQLLRLKHVSKNCNYIARGKQKQSGNGIFAGRDYKKGDIVEMNSFVILPSLPSTNKISEYYFSSYKQSLRNLVIGNISMFNHSLEPNVNPYDKFDYFNKVIIARATTDIKKNNEIYINYGSNYNYKKWGGKLIPKKNITKMKTE